VRVGGGILATFKTQHEAIDWARKQGHAPLVARVRHLNDKKKPITGGRPPNELRLLAFATDSALQRLRLQPRHASLIGGDRRSSSGSLAKFTANRRTSSRVSRFGRRAVQRSDMSGIGGRSGSARLALENDVDDLSETSAGCSMTHAWTHTRSLRVC